MLQLRRTVFRMVGSVLGAAVVLFAVGAAAQSELGVNGLGYSEPAGEVTITPPQIDGEFLWLNRFTPRAAQDSHTMLTDGLDLMGDARSSAKTTLDHGLGHDNERVFFGTVDVSESMAVTGRVGSISGDQFEPAEANLGVRFSTRAGEQLVLSVEPSITWTPSVSAQRLNLSLREESSVNVGAAATFALSDRWYISGMAQIEQGMAARMDGTVTLRDTAIIGGLLTGVRF